MKEVSNVIQIPASVIAGSIIRSAHRAHAQWAGACDRELQARLSWAFPLGIPGDVGDAWYEFCTEKADGSCGETAAHVPWDKLFNDFVGGYLTYHPAYKLAAEVLTEECVQ